MGIPVNVPFNANIPQATDSPSVTQGQFLTNNQSINQIIPVDHYGFGNNLGGWHNVIHLPQVSGNTNPPPTTTPVNAGQIYTRTVGGQLNLIYEDASGNIYQLTPNAPPSPTYPIVRSSAVFNSVPTIFNSYNASSVVRTASGQYTLNFPTISTSFPYVSIASNAFFTTLASISNTSVSILLFDLNGNPFNPSLMSITVFA
jgi:hypothetical protein